MISEMNKMKSPIRVIEEEKSENEEDSESNKLSSLGGSSPPPSSFTDSQVDIVADSFVTDKLSKNKHKNSINKQQSNIEQKGKSLFELE